MELRKLKLFMDKYPWVNFEDEYALKHFIEVNEGSIEFKGESCGGVEFNTSISGRRYLIPSQLERTYID